jgi:probable HAF family extracellular repeat protein
MLAPEPVHYIVRDLGTLEGGTFSQPFFLNRYGQVSGAASLPDNTYHAVLWSQELIIDLGTLAGSNSMAFGDNQRGRRSVKLKLLLQIQTGKTFVDSVPTTYVQRSCWNAAR